MHRVFVLLLAALDAFVAAAIGIAAALAPLAVVWFVAFGTGNASGLWPAASAIWQLGHAVPLQITLPVDYLAATGIDPGVAQFTLSLAPLGFAAFTLLFAARSGARAARARCGQRGRRATTESSTPCGRASTRRHVPGRRFPGSSRGVSPSRSPDCWVPVRSLSRSR